MDLPTYGGSGPKIEGLSDDEFLRRFIKKIDSGEIKLFIYNAVEYVALQKTYSYANELVERILNLFLCVLS